MLCPSAELFGKVGSPLCGGVCVPNKIIDVWHSRTWGREVQVLGIDIGSQEWKRMTNFHIWSHALRLGLDLDTAGTQVCLDEE